MGLNWGHININVSNLEASISFYEKLRLNLAEILRQWSQEVHPERGVEI